ncbi:unnamed protein product, partial [Medioppia subpectinata]
CDIREQLKLTEGTESTLNSTLIPRLYIGFYYKKITDLKPDLKVLVVKPEPKHTVHTKPVPTTGHTLDQKYIEICDTSSDENIGLEIVAEYRRHNCDQSLTRHTTDGQCLPFAKSKVTVSVDIKTVTPAETLQAPIPMDTTVADDRLVEPTTGPPVHSITDPNNSDSAVGLAQMDADIDNSGDSDPMFGHFSDDSLSDDTFCETRFAALMDRTAAYCADFKPLIGAVSDTDSISNIPSTDPTLIDVKPLLTYPSLQTVGVNRNGDQEVAVESKMVQTMYEYKCDFKGCYAMFVTEEILEKHKHVHQNRCPYCQCERRVESERLPDDNRLKAIDVREPPIHADRHIPVPPNPTEELHVLSAEPLTEPLSQPVPDFQDEHTWYLDTNTVEEVAINEEIVGGNSGQELSAQLTAPADVVDSSDQLVSNTDSDSTIISDHNGEEVTKKSIPENIGPQRGRHLARGHYRRHKKRLPDDRSDDSNDSDTNSDFDGNSDHSYGLRRDVSKRMASKTSENNGSTVSVDNTSNAYAFYIFMYFKKLIHILLQNSVESADSFGGNTDTIPHKPTHSGGKQFVCDFNDCHKSFTTNSNLFQHKSYVHLNERKFKCNEKNCGKKFQCSSHLNSHKRIHSREKPFVCDFNDCHKSYKTNSDLLKHKNRVHLNERKFKSNEKNCGKKFNTNSDLNQHKRTHSGEKQFVCDFNDCKKSYKLKGDLKKHINSIHLNVMKKL